MKKTKNTHQEGEILKLQFFKNTQKPTPWPISCTEEGKICFLHNKHRYVKDGEVWVCRVLICQEKQLIVEPVENVTPVTVMPQVPKKRSWLTVLFKILKGGQK